MKKMTAAMAALGVVAGLGAAALPLSSYASQAQKTVPVTAIIDDSLSIEIQDGDNTQLDANGVVLEGVVAGGDVVSKSVKVVVTNNGADTLNDTALTIEAANGQTSLNKKDANGLVTASIAAGSNVKANTSTSAWGYAVNASTKYTAVTSTAEPVAFNPELSDGSLDSKATATAQVTFGVAANSTQPSGTYVGGVIFTATANK